MYIEIIFSNQLKKMSPTGIVPNSFDLQEQRFIKLSVILIDIRNSGQSFTQTAFRQKRLLFLNDKLDLKK